MASSPTCVFVGKVMYDVVASRKDSMKIRVDHIICILDSAVRLRLDSSTSLYFSESCKTADEESQA